MATPQEAQFAKVAAIAGALVVVLGSLAFWATKHLKSSLEPPAVAAREAAERQAKDTPPIALPQPMPGRKDPHPVASAMDVLRRAERAAEAEPGSPTGDGKRAPACAPESVTVRRGSPARIASGLALLAVGPHTLASGAVLTFTITTEGHAWSEAVVEMPAVFDFETTKDAYYVEVKEAEPSSGLLRVVVGCRGR